MKKQVKGKTIVCTFRLTEDMVKTIDDLAERLKITRTEFVSKAVVMTVESDELMIRLFTSKFGTSVLELYKTIRNSLKRTAAVL